MKRAENYLLIFVLGFILIPELALTQSWVPSTLSGDRPDEKWLKYIHNEATRLMLHDSTCKRAEAFTGKENKVEGYKTCISVYKNDEQGEMDWNSWRVFFGELKSDHFTFSSEVVFDDNRGPVEEIQKEGKNSSTVYLMAKAAKLAIQNTDLSEKLEYEVIVNYYRSSEFSVYILPKWEEGAPYHLGGDYHLVIDAEKEKILKQKMLSNYVKVFYPHPLQQTKISMSKNDLSPYPTSTELLMMYRRKKGPPHISVCQGWHYGILSDVKIGILGREDDLNKKEWFQKWQQSN